jgi:cobalamin synthase
VRFAFKTDDCSRTPFLLAPLGILVGLQAALVWLAGLRLFDDRFLAAIAVLAVQYLCFNLAHFDSLLQTLGREKSLEARRDPPGGGFALCAGLLYLLAKHYLITRCAPRGLSWPMLAAVFAYPAVGRAAATLAACFPAPARTQGSAAAIPARSAPRAAAGIALSLALVLGLLAVSGLPRAGRAAAGLIVETGLSFLLGTAAAGGLAVLACRRDPGRFTGQAPGLAVEAGELLYLVLILVFLF